MIQKKILAALAKVVTALAPLDPEARRQVIEATHNLVEIGMGCQGGDDMSSNPRASKKKLAKRKR